MSLISSVLTGGIGGFVKGGVGGVIGGALGGLASEFGGDKVNIAKSLSRQVGCTIAQSDANQARALIQKGIDPCTGRAKNPIQTVDTSFDTGVPDRMVLEGRYATGGAMPGTQPIPVTGPGGVQMVTTNGGGALEYTATGLIRNVIVNGRRVSRRNAAAFIRKAGMEVGARGLGITLQQAAMVVLQQSQRPRRRRGISGKQISEAKRVIRTINSMQKSLGCTTRRAPARRKTSCR